VSQPTSELKRVLLATLTHLIQTREDDYLLLTRLFHHCQILDDRDLKKHRDYVSMLEGLKYYVNTNY
jgi:hypothetical protein